MQLLPCHVQLDIGAMDCPTWVWDPKGFFGEEHLLHAERQSIPLPVRQGNLEY